MEVFQVEVTVLLLLSGGCAMANGLNTPGQGARAIGMASAFTAVADDGAAVFYNPAGLNQLDGSTIQGTLTNLSPELRYTTLAGADETSTKRALAPSFFLTRHISDKFTAGFGIYAPYARDAALSADLANGFALQRAKILRTDLSAVVSYRANPELSIGGGIIVGYSQVNRSAPAGPTLRIKDNMDGVGVGGIIGVLWQANDRVKLGATYRTEMLVEHEGKRTLVTGGGATTSDARANTRYPASFGIGIAVKATQRLTVALDANWYGWSTFDKVTTRTDAFPVSTTPLNANDTSDIRLGAEYRMADGWTLRAGYAYAQGAFPATHIIPAQPDEDGHDISIGIGKASGNWQFDVAYQYAVTDETNTTANVFGYNGEYNINQHLFSVTAGYRF